MKSNIAAIAIAPTYSVQLVTWDPTEPVATRPLVFRYAPNSLNLFYAFDGNKNVSDVFYRLTSNGIGAHYDYAPFGATTRTHCDSSASFDIVSLNPYRFSSEVYDSELALIYYNYRHYSPSLGRFLSRDPIEEQGGLNLYAYSKNSPVIFIDLAGKFVFWASRDLDSFWAPVGNHHFILITFDAEPNLQYNLQAEKVSCSDNKPCKKTHYVLTLALFEGKDGFIEITPNKGADIESYKEFYCESEGLWYDWDYQRNRIAPPSDSESKFVDKILELYNNSKINFEKNKLKYTTPNKNCAAWVNGLFKTAEVSNDTRVESGEFWGVDWGEEDEDLVDYFKSPDNFKKAL